MKVEGLVIQTRSALVTFLRFIDRFLHGLRWKMLLVYLDHFIVIAPDFDTHIRHLGKVFQQLDGVGHKLKSTRC